MNDCRPPGMCHVQPDDIYILWERGVSIPTDFVLTSEMSPSILHKSATALSNIRSS